LKWGLRELKKLKKGKTEHGFMVCDVVPRKIPNMACQGFIRKLFTKCCYQAGVLLAF
jgi:hypothetical protein